MPYIKLKTPQKWTETPRNENHSAKRAPFIPKLYELPSKLIHFSSFGSALNWKYLFFFFCEESFCHFSLLKGWRSFKTCSPKRKTAQIYRSGSGFQAQLDPRDKNHTLQNLSRRALRSTCVKCLCLVVPGKCMGLILSYSCSGSVSLKLFQMWKYFFRKGTISFHLLASSLSFLHILQMLRLFSMSLGTPEKEREDLFWRLENNASQRLRLECICHRLKVSAPVPRFICWNPAPQGDGVRRWHPCGVISRVSFLIEETPESALPPSATWGHSEQKVGRKQALATRAASTLILEF